VRRLELTVQTPRDDHAAFRSSFSNMPARVLQVLVPIRDGEIVDSVRRTITFNTDDRRAVEKVQPAYSEKSAVALEQTHQREADRIGPRR
jgi:hypothetical protein